MAFTTSTVSYPGISYSGGTNQGGGAQVLIYSPAKGTWELNQLMLPVNIDAEDTIIIPVNPYKDPKNPQAMVFEITKKQQERLSKIVGNLKLQEELEKILASKL